MSPSISNILVDDFKLMLNLPPIVKTDLVKPSFPSSKAPSNPTTGIHESQTIMDVDGNWIDSHKGMDHEIPASPPMTDASSNYNMYDWDVTPGGYDEIFIDSEPLAVVDELGVGNPIVTADAALPEVVQKPVYSIFTETKKRVEKHRHDEEKVDGGKAAVDYKSI
jgi:hypothetical protein